MMSPMLKPLSNISNGFPPPSEPSAPRNRTPASAAAQPPQTTGGTRCPARRAKMGVMTTESCVKNDARAAPVSARPALSNPCVPRFQVASSREAPQNPAGSAAAAVPGFLPLEPPHESRGMNTKTVRNCLTRDKAAGVGGPRREYRPRRQMPNEPYSAATITSSSCGHQLWAERPLAGLPASPAMLVADVAVATRAGERRCARLHRRLSQPLCRLAPARRAAAAATAANAARVRAVPAPARPTFLPAGAALLAGGGARRARGLLPASAAGAGAPPANCVAPQNCPMAAREGGHVRPR
mmetsp:Transcript_104832/g.313182  ORF Transcript_104832/g.313182 Transcript_104832/m.313182 type:complete len:297 (+) Transcript_104832:562-1452(+)